MYTFIVREYEEYSGGRVLLPLQKLIQRLEPTNLIFWSLREITLIGDFSFFGISIPDVEKLSRHLSHGLGLANTDFQAFLKTDFQLIDGYIDAYGKDFLEPLFVIECLDSTQWEISTDSMEFASKLERAGFQRI